MKKATRSTYHQKIKYIELLSKDMSQFWRSVGDLIGKGKQTSNIIDDFSNDNEVYECFAHSYEHICNQVI